MASPFHCRDQERRERVRTAPGTPLNGIDYLEVDESDQALLHVHFIHPLPGQAGGAPLEDENLRIEGGLRVTGIRAAVAGCAGQELTVRASAPGDFSTYLLRLVAGRGSDAPPPGFDRQLSAIQFSFKAACPSEFDCRAETSCPPEPLPSPAIDYLAKDYASFRRLLLDRLSTQLPGWRERSPADLTVTLVELLAYVADHLSYAQDAVGTEAYLGTARRRVSVRRHARLLDYAMHDGCNARVFVVVAAGAGLVPGHDRLEAGTLLLAAGEASKAALPPEALEPMIAAGAPVFQTLHALTLRPEHDELRFHTWSDGACCLPRGATRATLREPSEGALRLEPGDVLILEEVRSPTTGRSQDADPTHRHAVRITSVGDSLEDQIEGCWTREITWGEADALLFPLCISSTVGDRMLRDVSVARGNVVLADHGRSTGPHPLDPPLASGPASRPYRPRLLHGGVTQAVPYTHADAMQRPASSTLRQAPGDGVPALKLGAPDGSAWVARRDLLAAGPFERAFVAELESDGVVTLRFGDDLHGRRPPGGVALQATYRIGGGRAGNVGAGSIRVLGTSDALLRAAILGVRNPLPAVGGADPESVEEVRQFAPQAFRRQARAVTEADYARVAEDYPGVQRAAATLRWTGSWYTMFVTVDRVGGASATKDADFAAGLRRRLEGHRIAGYDLELADPLPVPLDIALLVCVRPGLFNADVKRALRAALTRGLRPDGTAGFFHPDRFTFGQALPLSHLVDAVMAVPGVTSVEVRRFHRFGRAPNQELELGRIAVAPLEVLRLDDDPSAPENGRLDLDVQGGL